MGRPPLYTVLVAAVTDIINNRTYLPGVRPIFTCVSYVDVVFIIATTQYNTDVLSLFVNNKRVLERQKKKRQHYTYTAAL